MGYPSPKFMFQTACFFGFALNRILQETNENGSKKVDDSGGCSFGCALLAEGLCLRRKESGDLGRGISPVACAPCPSALGIRGPGRRSSIKFRVRPPGQRAVRHSRSAQRDEVGRPPAKT